MASLPTTQTFSLHALGLAMDGGVSWHVPSSPKAHAIGFSATISISRWCPSDQYALLGASAWWCSGVRIDAIEAFDPKRVASRILGMGDVVSLVERAAETIKQDEAEALAKKMAQGKFDLEDLRMQLRQMQNMGGLGMLAGMLPGMKKAKAAMAASNMDDRVLLHMDAIIGSMTPKERKRPELLNAKRKKRVAAGSGTQVQDVNKVLKMHQEMSRAMKQIKKMGGLKGLGALFGGGGMGAAMPGLGGPGGMPGMGGAKGPGVDRSTLPPDLQDLLKKK